MDAGDLLVLREGLASQTCDASVSYESGSVDDLTGVSKRTAWPVNRTTSLYDEKSSSEENP